MNIKDEIIEGNKAASKMFYFLIIALTPLLLIAIIYFQSPTNEMLTDIAQKSKGFPSIYSLNRPVLSRVMGLYIKTSPVFALIVFFTSCKNLRLKKSTLLNQAIMVYLLFTVFFAILIYVFLFSNTELTSSAKLLHFASTNDLNLILFYVSLFTGIYIFSYLYLWFSIGIYRLFKGR